MEQHLCHAVDCNVRVLPTRLMCSPHWFMLPPSMRKLIWQTYKPGQEVTKTPTPEYIAAARAAINYVARLEGKPELPDNTEIRKTIEQIIKGE